MHKPKMILFDYGQTLIAEDSFDGIKGTEAVLKFATKNKYNKTAQEIQEFVKELNSELGRFNSQTRHLMQIEIPNHMFTKYLYESQGIQIDLKPEEIDKIFWDAASPGKPTDGIKDFLAFLRENKINIKRKIWVKKSICVCENLRMSTKRIRQRKVYRYAGTNGF